MMLCRCFKKNPYQQLSGGTCTVRIISYWPDSSACLRKVKPLANPLVVLCMLSFERMCSKSSFRFYYMLVSYSFYLKSDGAKKRYFLLD